jgi:protein-tyrosine kinase
MGKIDQALGPAQEEYQGGPRSVASEPQFANGTPPPIPAPTSRDASLPPGLNSARGAREPYEELKANLLTRRANGSLKTILFASTSHGDGCSTTAVNFAATLAKDASLKVLLVDVNPRTPALHEVFDVSEAEGVSDLLTRSGNIACKINKVSPGGYYVLPWGRNHSAGACLFDSSRFDRLLQGVREKFDYVILDGPPVPAFPECLVLCAKVDGVVLVLESGKTRRQVALRARKQVEEVGGKMLGVVLNKRKYYIPEWIYRRL